MTRSTAEPCVLIAAGGTGGHVIPGLEVAKELRRRGWLCVFVGTARGFEGRLVPAAGFDLRYVPVGALNRVSLRRRLTTLLLLPAAFSVAAGLVLRYRPAAALSLGGYAAGPLVLASALMDVPLVLLEPNARPGLANRLAALVARRALVCHPRAAKRFRSASCQLARLPVRREFFEAREKAPGEPFTVLILGGSQGAVRLNEAALEAVRIWRDEGRRCPRLLHQTGERDAEEVSAAYREAGVEAVAAAFFDNMPRLFSQADLVVCRAGASVIAELCAAGKPAVLVPFPFAADNHQQANGAAVADAGGALLCDDSEWTGERMVREIDALSADPVRLQRMSRALARLSPRGAAEDAADAVAQAAARSGGLN